MTRKLLFITPFIDGSGGVQKFLSIRTQYLVEKWGYTIRILVTNARTKQTFFNFDHLEVVSRRIPGKGPFYFYHYRRIVKQQLRDFKPDISIIVDNGIKGHCLPRFIKTPDNCVLFEEHLYRFFRSKEHPDTLFNRLKNQLINKIVDWSMAKADCVVVLVPENRKEWKHNKIEVIPNPLPQALQGREKKDYTAQKAIAVGRHTHQKGFDRLLRIWAAVVQEFPDWQLDIYGDREEVHLQQIIEDLQLQQQVTLHEPVVNIEEKYEQASLFLMSSRYEGFGNVLVEALACGLPCMAFDCPTGPGYIIEDGKNGWLIPEGKEQVYVDRLKTLLQEEDLRKKMGQNALTSTSRFDLNHVMGLWHQLFKEIRA